MTDQIQLPEKSHCPGCGNKPTEESIVKVKLSDVGYHHQDVWLECESEKCDRKWMIGIPIDAQHDTNSDLWCNSCDEAYAFTHFGKLELAHDQIRFLVKCPECYTSWRITRDIDKDDMFLPGYPPITGSKDGATPRGWVE